MMTTNEIDVVLHPNEIYVPYLDSAQRTQIFFGGSASGKSFFLAQRTVLDVLMGRNYLVVRNVANTLRQSVYNQVVKAISDMGLVSQFVITKSEMTITCRHNGKQILFAGLDDVEKLKSITPARGVLTDIWGEEATEIGRDTSKQLEKRLRGLTDGNMPKRITFSFNPITKLHWIYKEFFGNWDEGKSLYQDDGLLILKTTYKDNAFLAEDDVRGLEDESDPYYHDVYTLGNWGTLGKVIFKNWRVEDLSDKIPRFDNIMNGLDFGFSEDPNALIRVHVDEKRKKLYVFEEMYRTGMHDDELAEELHKRIGSQYVTCDSEDPKAIDDLCRRGIRAIGAVKGPDSIRYGIRFLQGFEIIVHTTCVRLRRELELYEWDKDKYGNVLSRPNKNTPHHCLTGNTVVETTEGSVQISDLVGKTGKVYCYDEENDRPATGSFGDVRKTQSQVPVYEITLQDGRRVTATAEHPFLTRQGWKQLKDIGDHDELLCLGGV